MTAAKFAPSWKAPSEVAPSPKNTSVHVRSPRKRFPHANPAAWGTWVAMGTQSDATLDSRGFHQPAGWPRHQERIVDVGHAAEQADGRLAVAREDPVLPVEGVGGAHLHRLVAPVDRVRADAPLPVIDDRALVVRAEENELPVELEEVGVGQAVYGGVRDGVAVADHAPETGLGRKHLGHRPATLAHATAEGPREDDRHTEDRQHGEDPCDSEHGVTAYGLRNDGEEQRADDSCPGNYRADDEQSQPRGSAPEGHSRARLDRPEGELGDRNEAGREEPRSGIEPLADEGCAVTHAEQGQSDRHHSSPPEDEAAGEESQPCEHPDRRRAGILARGQANGEREERRAHDGADAGRYARIALA